MANLNVREVPDRVHRVLVRRAAARGMSLRQYTIEVLEAHCEQPTMDEWLDDLKQLKPARKPISGARAVRAARDEDDEKVAGARRRR